MNGEWFGWHVTNDTRNWCASGIRQFKIGLQTVSESSGCRVSRPQVPNGKETRTFLVATCVQQSSAFDPCVCCQPLDFLERSVAGACVHAAACAGFSLIQMKPYAGRHVCHSNSRADALAKSPQINDRRRRLSSYSAQHNSRKSSSTESLRGNVVKTMCDRRVFNVDVQYFGFMSIRLPWSVCRCAAIDGRTTRCKYERLTLRGVQFAR